MSRPDYCRFVKEEKQGKSLGRKCQFSVNQLNVHLIIVEYFSVGETSFSFEDNRRTVVYYSKLLNKY